MQAYVELFSQLTKKISIWNSLFSLTLGGYDLLTKIDVDGLAKNGKKLSQISGQNKLFLTFSSIFDGWYVPNHAK